MERIVNTGLSTEINCKIEFNEASTGILVEGIAIKSVDGWEFITLLLRLVALNLSW